VCSGTPAPTKIPDRTSERQAPQSFVVVPSSVQAVPSEPVATCRRSAHTPLDATRSFSEREQRNIFAPRYLKNYVW